MYCTNIHEEIEVFSKEVETRISDNQALKYTILAFLTEIVNLYSKSLSNWRNVAELTKGSKDTTPYSNSIRILINSQKDKG